MRHLFLRLSLVVVEADVVHDDVGHGVLLQDMLPHIGGLVATVGVYGIARTLPIGQTLVERHEIGLVEVKACGEKHLILVHREMCQTATEVQQWLFRIAIC